MRRMEENFEAEKALEALESKDLAAAQNARSFINNAFKQTKESWLVNGLFDYYLQTGRCADILCGISREPHDKHLIEKMIEGVKSLSGETRKRTVALLGEVLCKQPTWLYKVTDHKLLSTHSSLLVELLRLLKAETDVVILLTGLLDLVMIIPSIPAYINSSLLKSIFEVFGGLVRREGLQGAEGAHLALGVYCLFHRLYAMYPSNFLSYLRTHFSSLDDRVLFFRSILPMLEKVRMHPGLILDSKEVETNPSHWRGKEYHEIIAECSNLSLDPYESSLPEKKTAIFPESQPPELNSESKCDLGERLTEAILSLPTSPFINQDFNSEGVDLSSFLGELTAPSTPVSVTSALSTPTLSVTSNRTDSPYLTPRGTPDINLTKVGETVPITLTSSAARKISFGNVGNAEHGVSSPGSTPSSPLRPIQRIRRDSVFDSQELLTVEMIPSLPRDSLIFRKLEKIHTEQQRKGNSAPSVSPKKSENIRPIAMFPVSHKLEDVRPIAMFPTHSVVGQSPERPHEFNDRLVKYHKLGPLAPPPTNPLQSGQSPSDEHMNVDCGQSSLYPKEGLLLAGHEGMTAFTTEVDMTFEPSPGSSPLASIRFLFEKKVKKLKKKRSSSCPNVKMPMSEELEEMEFSEVVEGSEDGVEEEGRSEACLAVEERRKDSYEYLLRRVVPGVVCPPSRSLPSPHLLLDLCVEKAASLHNPKGEERLGREVDLLRAQLLFERHRRDAHALRNRRLASQANHLHRATQHNATLSLRVYSLEQEVVTLKRDILTIRGMAVAKERDLEAVVSDLQAKVETYQRQLSEAGDEKTFLENRMTFLKVDLAALTEDWQYARATLFSAENEIQHLRSRYDVVDELRSENEESKRKIQMLGEVIRDQREASIKTKAIPKASEIEELEIVQRTFGYEIQDLRKELDQKTNELGLAVGTIHDLERKLRTTEALIKKHATVVRNNSKEYNAQLEAVAKRYESVKDANLKLEMDNLALQHQITLKDSLSQVVVGRERVPMSPLTADNSAYDSPPSNFSEDSPSISPDYSPNDSLGRTRNNSLVTPSFSPLFGDSALTDLMELLDKPSAPNSTQPSTPRARSKSFNLDYRRPGFSKGSPKRDLR